LHVQIPGAALAAPGIQPTEGELAMVEIILVAAAAALAGFTQGLAGFGSVLVVLPAFTALTGIKTAVPLANLFAIGLSLYLCVQLRSLRHWSLIWPLIVTALPGIFFGTWMLKIVSPRSLELALAATLGLFCLYSLLTKAHTKTFGRPWGYAAGFSSGLLGGSIGAYGPPVVLYFGVQPFDVEVAKSAMSGFFFLGGLGIGVSHAVGGLIDTRVLFLTAISFPSLAAGVFLGSACEGRLNERTYSKLILILLLLFSVLLVCKPFLAGLQESWFNFH
jgi:uncharacterized protein